MYGVFVSHGWHDRWIAKQMARLISDAGAAPFIDIFDITSGDRIEAKVWQGLVQCDELVALLTPWSVDRKWVWTEMSSAWVLQKRFVGVLHGVTLTEIDEKHGGLAILAPTKILSLNDFDHYIEEMSKRMSERAPL